MDKMREEFERWACQRCYRLDDYSGRKYPSVSTNGAWTAWQHLYPMVEAAYREGHEEGFSEGAYNNSRDTDFDWNNSTAKARLEGKDE